MNMLASGFANFINGIFANWQFLLFAIGAVLLLLTILFRKFRLTALILALVAVAIGGVLIVDLVIQAVNWDLPDLVAFLVKWVPTVLFTATVLLATLIGVTRGLRKSLILLVHEVVLAAVCITAYAVLVSQPSVNTLMLKVVDTFMGGNGSLKRALGVTADCRGIKEVFVEWLPTVIKGDFSIMLNESKAYIYTLADLIYHVAFALLLYIIFLILDFIMYIVYHCCYSERKYKAKIQQRYSENKVDRRYSKHRLGGGVVGLMRGVVIGLISLSFLGTAFYVVAGRGEGKLKDFDFGDSNVNEYYSVYRSIESYGTHGIFKILNSISSTEDVPYYLFAADLVFSGELNDEELGITDNVVFRDELSAYTDFARDTMALLIKYGGDKLTPLINGKATDSAFNTVVDVMSDEMFRAEFNDLINEFDSRTYIINFALSFVNAALANIDDMSFAPSVSADNRELLKIMFTKGYLSDTIPDEKALKYVSGSLEITAVQPYINVSRLVNKKDIQIIFNIVLDVLGEKITTTDEVLKLVGDILPEVKKISLLNENRAEELDPVLGRLYCYAANRYLTEEGSAGVRYADIYADNIEWVGEINSLIGVAESSLNLYDNISSSSQPLEMLVAIFDKNNNAYNENIAYYDNIAKGVLKSRILGKTLSTSRIYTLIEKGLSSVFKDPYLPEDIVYESTFDQDGNLVQAGEMFNVLNGLGAVGKCGTILPYLVDFNSNDDLEPLLKELSAVIGNKDEYGYSVADYLVQSKLLRSAVSAAMLKHGGEYVHVPVAALETAQGGQPVNYIKQSELTVLFTNLPELVEFIVPVLSDDNADMKAIIAEFVEKPVFERLLNESTVFEGTVALHLVDALKDDETVVISQSLKTDLDGWVTVAGRNGELKNLLAALETVNIKVGELLGEDFDTDKITDGLTALSIADLDKCLKSSVLHYTISRYITDETNDYGSLKLIVPAAAQKQLSGDVLPALVKNDEVAYILQLLKEFDLSAESEIDVSTVLVNLVKNKQLLEKSYILSASVVYSLVENEDVKEMLELPAEYTEAATAERLKKLSSANPWKKEIVRLVNALDEIMGISVSDDFTFDEDKLSVSVKSFLKTMNDKVSVGSDVTRLKVCYSSEIMRVSITARLDELLADSEIDQSLMYGAKSGGNYTETELSSLSNVLNTFEIDVDDIDAENLTGKIKEKVLKLNEPGKTPGKTMLNEVYPSVIFTGILSSELDDVLLRDTDEEGNPDPKIDEKILSQIKGGTTRYSEPLIADLIDSINGLGVENFDQLSDLDVETVKEHKDNIDVVCKSLIVRGVFTKQISENNTLGADHPLAYETDIKIVKTNEIDSIVNLGDKLDDVESTYFDEVSLAQIRKNLFYTDGTVKSYLILRALSDSIKDSSQLLVNRELIDRYECIDSREVWLLCDAFIALFGEEATVNSVTEENGIRYPRGEARTAALSSEIVCAKLTEQFRTRSEGKVYVSGANVSEFVDYRTKTSNYLLSNGELTALFSALDIVNVGEESGSFAIPVRFNINNLVGYYQSACLDELFVSDVIRYKICDTVVSMSGGEETYEEEAVEIKNGVTETVKALTWEQIEVYIAGYVQIFG